MADEWNGHWVYSDLMWKLIIGKRPYVLNREPNSTHIKILKEEGFKIVCERRIKAKSNLEINDLSSKFKSISSNDLTTIGTFLQAVKPN